MPDEQIDIVNEQNEPTGQVVSRKEAHERGLWHRCASVYFYRVREDKIGLLVHLRSASKASDPNKRDIAFGGHLKAGQGLMEAAIEEIREEVGITMQEPDIVEGGWLVVEWKCHFDKEHFYRFEGDISDLRLQEEEIQMVQWMSLEDIAGEITAHPEEWTHESDELERVAVFLRELIINQHSH